MVYPSLLIGGYALCRKSSESAIGKFVGRDYGFIRGCLIASYGKLVHNLFNGREGRFKDIVTVIGYSMLPMVLTYIPATIISWFIAADEEAIYYLLTTLPILYFAILLLIGIMVIHNFGLGKTIATILFSLIAFILIIFVILLMFSLVQQVMLFLRSAYDELILRV